MEINEAIVMKYTMRGKLCVVLRSVLLRFMTADVLQESNFTIRARCRREKFVAMDMSLVSSNAVQVFSFLLIKISTEFSTTETRCSLYLTTQPQDAPCTSLHNHNMPTVLHYTTTRTLKLHDRAQSMTKDGQLVSRVKNP
jgi:hypothetical protein